MPLSVTQDHSRNDQMVSNVVRSETQVLTNTFERLSVQIPLKHFAHLRSRRARSSYADVSLPEQCCQSVTTEIDTVGDPAKRLSSEVARFHRFECFAGVSALAVWARITRCSRPNRTRAGADFDKPSARSTI